MHKNIIPRLKAIVVIHEATTGPGHDLRDFLLQQGIDELLLIAHPLLFVKENLKKSSRYELYKNSKLVKEKTAFHWIGPEYLLYVKDFIYTLWWSLRLIGKCDIFFGLGNLNALAGCILKLVGRTSKVIYYVIDYIPQRFSNKLVNKVYQRIEKFCALKSDWTWNLSPVMIEERNKKWKIEFFHQLVVMHGVHFKRIKRFPFKEVDKSEILYMGALLKKQGIQLVLEALPEIKKRITNAKFTIIGSGPYENELRKLVKKLDLDERVHFLGYIPNHEEVENRMAKAAVAVALYEENPDNYTYYTDPGKVKNYLGAGVPVIITDVPYIARIIEKARCGIIVSYQKKELAKKLISFLSDEKTMREYRMNAVKFARQYDWDLVFAQALEPLLENINA